MNLKNSINWKLFFIMFIGGCFSVIAVIPYINDLLLKNADKLPLSTTLVLIFSVIQTIVILIVALYIGLKLIDSLDLELPILRNIASGEPVNINLRSYIGSSVLIGIIVGIMILAADYVFFLLNSPISFFTTELPSWWKGLMASFYGGIFEEILLRFFLMTLLIWLFVKVTGKTDGKIYRIGTWLSIIAVAIIFGIMHLPATMQITSLTPLVVARGIILNGFGGVVFGYLYWKRGLESAIIAHFSTDLVLHVIWGLIMI